MWYAKKSINIFLIMYVLSRPKRDDNNLRDAIEMYMSKKYTLDEIKEQTNISRATLYRHLDK